MATARITNILRQQIHDAAMKNAFAAEKAQLEADWKAFSLKVYDKIVAKKDQALIEQLPRELFWRTSSKEALIAPNVKAHDRLTLKFDKDMAFPQSWQYRRGEAVVDAKLHAEFRKLEDRKDAIEASEEELKSSINQVLYSATTVAKLLEVWPESDPFIPDWAKNVVKNTNLPAVCVSGLNALLAKALGVPMLTAA